MIKAEYIYLSKANRDVLLFVSLMKEIELALKLQGEAPTVLCSIFEKQRQSRGDRARGFPINTISYEAHGYQLPSLPEFLCEW